MKFLAYISTFFLLLVLSSGCDKFLQKDLLTAVTEENFYQTEEDALAALYAAYSTLQYDGQLTPSGQFRWFWGDVVSDDTDKGGSGPNDAASLGRLERFEGSSNNELLHAEWLADYDAIYYSNVVLDKVPGIEMDPFKRDQILGEAKFIRAWGYYQLVTMFGGVPLVDKVLSPSEDLIPRASEDEIWDFIEKDLTEAIAVLPLKSQYTPEELGRITKGAAQGVLLKAQIWRKKWTLAQQTAEAIMDSDEYELEANYEDIFQGFSEHGSESVFEITYMNSSTGDWGRFEDGTLTNVFQRARGDFGGFGFNLPTQDFVDEFEINDPRLAATVFMVGDPMGDRGTFTLEATGYPHLYYAKKYFLNRGEEAPIGDVNVNGPSNDRVIRFADVLLMHAEAAYHNGAEEVARTSLNLIRKRARGSNSVIVVPAVNASGPALLDAIYHERRVELGLEGHRFFDLLRTDRAGEVMRAAGFNFNDGVHEKFPIPLTEIQLSNGQIEQNPGY